MEFNERIKHFRKQADLSQIYVAEKIGVAKSTYSLYESGKRQPDVEKIKLISEVLKVSADDLLGINFKKELNESEEYIIKKFNFLNEQGQDYILNQFELALSHDKYKKFNQDIPSTNTS